MLKAILKTKGVLAEPNISAMPTLTVPNVLPACRTVASSPPALPLRWGRRFDENLPVVRDLEHARSDATKAEYQAKRNEAYRLLQASAFRALKPLRSPRRPKPAPQPLGPLRSMPSRVTIDLPISLG